MRIREKNIEKYLREQVKAAGGWAPKWESPGNAGVPDRIIFFPGGRIFFVELKAPGRKPTPLQLVKAEKIQGYGQTVLVIDSKQKVDEFIRHVQYGVY